MINSGLFRIGSNGNALLSVIESGRSLASTFTRFPILVPVHVLVFASVLLLIPEVYAAALRPGQRPRDAIVNTVERCGAGRLTDRQGRILESRERDREREKE